MIIHRAFYREATRTATAITLVLLVIFVFISLTVLLGRAVSGDTSSDIVFTLLGLQTLRRLDQLLPLSIYLGALLTISRWYRDNEMAALGACGFGLPQLLRPALRFGVIAAVMIGFFAFYLSPLALRLSDQAKEQSAHRSEVSLIAPGIFTETYDSQRILYAEKLDDNGNFDTVFVSNIPAAHRAVAIARSGTPITDSGSGKRYLSLQNGAFYDGTPGQTDYRIVQFDTLLMRMEPKPVTDTSVSDSAQPTLALLRAGGNGASAELQWRLARPLSMVILVLFAVVLAYTDARRGRLTNLFVAILVYFIYSNLIGLGDALLRKSKIPPAAGLWWVHAALAVFSVYLVWRRVTNRPLFAWPRLRGRS
jgi:lipopolysaccharide export system permease protein